jgi:hypothetical protein
MTKEELNARRHRRAIMDAAASTWDPVEGARLAGMLRDAANGHPAAQIPWPHRLLHDAANALDAKVND